MISSIKDSSPMLTRPHTEQNKKVDIWRLAAAPVILQKKTPFNLIGIANTI
jgi:hypothetical protein